MVSLAFRLCHVCLCDSFIFLERLEMVRLEQLCLYCCESVFCYIEYHGCVHGVRDMSL